ncbi:Uncharacterised protein [uncultured archaeon]|nr:Uncharacterised protein [uncultured archaeon]
MAQDEYTELKCQRCGRKTNKLLVHHISYDPEITEIVCRRCQSKAHHGKGKVRPDNFTTKREVIPPIPNSRTFVREKYRVVLPIEMRIGKGIAIGDTLEFKEFPTSPDFLLVKVLRIPKAIAPQEEAIRATM